jgi:hypothetical protein
MTDRLCLIRRGILEVSCVGNSLMNRTESSIDGLTAAASNSSAVRRWDWPVPEVGRVKGSAVRRGERAGLASAAKPFLVARLSFAEPPAE